MDTIRTILLGLAFAACTAGSGDPDPTPGGDGDPDSPADDPTAQTGDDDDDDVGCVDGWCDPDTTGGEGEDVDPSCEPRACGEQCGVVDDGCGGTVNCGPCGCEPTTCEEAGASCGSIDDGCGGTIDCDDEDAPCSGDCRDNQCVCAGDDLEPNDTSGVAIELGTLSQGDGVELSQDDVNLSSADDADWYSVTVTDDWSWGNPVLSVHVNAGDGGDVQVTAYYFCDYGPDGAHTCEQGSAYSDGFGNGCQGGAQVTLDTECDWSDETGTMYVRIAPGEQALACESYSVTIEAT